MNIFFKIFISLALVLATVGCQTNNSAKQAPDGNITNPTPTPGPTTDPTVEPTVQPTAEPTVAPTDEPTEEPTEPITVIDVILPISTKEVTLNSEIVNISVTVIDDKNNPYSEGLVKIVYPDDIRQGRDIGYFTTSSVAPINGVANFVYTAPSDLSVNTSNLVFSFYHDSNPTATLPYTITINPENNQVVLTNYELRTANPDDVSMELETSKVVSYTVYDDNNQQLLDTDIISMVITSLNPDIGILEDTYGNSGPSLTVTDKNNVTINIVSNTKSGIVPIKVDASFVDVNDENQTLTQVFNMLVLSGPPSAISLAYAGTTQASDRAKFIEKWIVTVTDRYSNKVNSNPAISMGMIAGYTKSSDPAVGNEGNYTYYNPGSATTLDATADTFTSHVNTFGNVDDSTDILVLTGTGYKYPALGKWDISKIDDSTLSIIDDYDSNNTTELGFAVGNNQREDTCNPGVKWIANVYPESGKYIIEDTGTLAISVEYDYYLVGKSTMLWVNLVGIQHSTNETIRIGEARKVTLRGLGLESTGLSFGQGFLGTTRFFISISDTVEWYKNANFGYFVEVTGDGNTYTVPETSMNNGITSCIEGGVAYVDVNITASASAGTIEIKNILPGSEF